MPSLVPRRGVCLVAAVGLAAAGLFAAGCGPAYRPLPYVPKPEAAPPMAACHDGVGHIKGNKPWILGGTCCCTPTLENYNLHVSQGTLDRSMTYEAYLALYQERGIVTDLDHKGCGNLCARGPHVLLGGHCMATPTPGTWMYERVTYGPHETITGESLKAKPPEPNPAAATTW